MSATAGWLTVALRALLLRRSRIFSFPRIAAVAKLSKSGHKSKTKKNLFEGSVDIFQLDQALIERYETFADLALEISSQVDAALLISTES